MEESIKVLAVDDSIIYRQILKKVVDSIPETECIATAANGMIALRKIEELRPDVVLLDVTMPEMDGVETLRHIRAKFPKVVAIMISGTTAETAESTIQSLALGALDFIQKPKSNSSEESFRFLKETLGELIEGAFKDRKILPQDPAPKPMVSRPPVSPAPQSTKGPINLMLIASSTGGPNALSQLLKSITAPLACPLIIIQHMPAVFTRSLAESLDKLCVMPVKEAENHDVLKDGHVYILPGGEHMHVISSSGHHYLSLSDEPPVNNCKPAADVLFKSVARSFQKNVLSVVLTGMGRDGAQGVQDLKDSGILSLSIAQDEDSSVVWGMPKSVYEAGLADEVLALESIGPYLSKLHFESIQ